MAPLPPDSAYTFWSNDWLGSWDAAGVREASDAHAAGDFQRSSQLFDSMLRDPRIFAAVLQRIGPPLSLVHSVQGASRWNGKGLAERARADAEVLFVDQSTAFPFGVFAGMFASLAVHGLAILQVVWHAREDGSHVDPVVSEWPIHATAWNPTRKGYDAITSTGDVVPIVHGDGRWIIVASRGSEPHRMGALRALAASWVDRANAVIDRREHAAAHGSPNVVGTLPESIEPKGKVGASFAAEIRKLQRPKGGAVLPFGSKVQFLEAQTLSFAVFENMIKSDNADIALALLGQDGTTENSGGAYTKILALKNVRFDIVEMDVRASGTALTTGLLVHHAAKNYGRADVAGSLVWHLPDPEEDSRIAELANRHRALTELVAKYRAIGVEPNLDQLAAELRVTLPGRPGTAAPALVAGPVDLDNPPPS